MQLYILRFHAHQSKFCRINKIQKFLKGWGVGVEETKRERGWWWLGWKFWKKILVNIYVINMCLNKLIKDISSNRIIIKSFDPLLWITTKVLIKLVIEGSGSKDLILARLHIIINYITVSFLLFSYSSVFVPSFIIFL